jgi:hypothetical protein
LDRVEILLLAAMVVFLILVNLAISNVFSKQLDLKKPRATTVSKIRLKQLDLLGEEKKPEQQGEEFQHGPISSLSFLRRLLENHYKGLMYREEFVEVNVVV